MKALTVLNSRWTAATVLLLATLTTWSVAASQEPSAGGAAEMDPPVAEDSARISGNELALRGPVDESVYIVGPGDGFEVTLWGPTLVTLNESVSLEGDLVLPGVAVIPVAGRTLAEAKEKVAERLSGVYRNVEITVSLVKLRRILVNVLGAVEEPGTYEATALAPASMLLDDAGGLLRNASERDISIRRREGDEERVDLVRYRNTGDVSADPPVLDGDVIFVPFARRYAHIAGGVSRPGRYEIVPGETVSSLVDLAGGLRRGALSDSLELRTYGDDETIETLLLTMAAASSRVLADGDMVTVRVDPEWRMPDQVTVRGEVLYPGNYGITEGVDRISDVVERAGGPTADASVRTGVLLRPGPELEEDPEFERFSEMGMSDPEPLEYAYLKMLYRSSSGRVSVDFERALEGDSEEDVLLADGDVIFLPKATSTVNVVGEVVSPGRVEYEPGRRYGYYVTEAGGFSELAWRSRIRVIKAATGVRRPARNAGSLEPGDTVWVPERPESDLLEFLTDIAALVSSAATIYLVFRN